MHDKSDRIGRCVGYPDKSIPVLNLQIHVRKTSMVCKIRSYALLRTRIGRLAGRPASSRLSSGYDL